MDIIAHRPPRGELVESFDGTKVHAIYRKNRLPCIIFVHGVTGWHGTWHPIPEHFHRKGHSTLVLDIRGHGQSDTPPSPTINDAARDLAALISHFDIKKPHFIGHCMGSQVILSYLRSHPTGARSAVLISPHYNIQGDPDMRRRIGLSSTYFKALSRFQKKTRKGEILIEKVRGIGDLSFLLRTRIASLASFKVTAQFFDSMSSFNEEKTLKKIKMPLLIIHGTNDWLTPYRIAKQMKNIKPSAHLIPIRGGHHDLVLNNHPELTRIIDAFLKGIT